MDEDFSGDPDAVNLEYVWQQGAHITKEGVEMCIVDMTDKHLKNTIKYFESKYDVSPLKKELRRRAKNKLKVTNLNKQHE